MVRVAINGGGRIGRIAIRLALAKFPNDLEIVAVNDPFADPKSFAYLLKYDTVHGRFDGDVVAKEGGVEINGKFVKFFTERNPKQINWNSVNVDVVLECSGVFKGQGEESAGGHAATAGVNDKVKLIIISCPADAGVPTFVMGVNNEQYEKDMKVVSNASCTTNCLAPIAKVLHDNWGIESGLMTTVHAGTATQLVVDGASKKDFRGGRSVFNNIIPSSTGAAKAVGLVIPELNGKLTGMSFRVPTANCSVVDLTVQLKKGAPYKEICAKMKEASQTGSLVGVLGYTEDDVVSSDFIGELCTSVFDAKAGIALSDNFVKVVSWYDNEASFTSNMLKLAVFASKKQSA